MIWFPLTNAAISMPNVRVYAKTRTSYSKDTPAAPSVIASGVRDE